MLVQARIARDKCVMVLTMDLGAGEYVRLLGEDYITGTQWHRKVGDAGEVS